MNAWGNSQEGAMASGYGTAQGIYALDPRATEGTIGRRFWAYLIDIVVIACLMTLLWVAIAFIGLITLGFGWGLFALLPLTAIVYNALTIGGPAQATIGMRVAGIRVVDAVTGGRVSMVIAAVHALLFYVAASTFVLWAIDVIIGLARDDRRFGHDLVTGVVLLRVS
jgi:uncharacterized RDD family membrane protein YckC